MYFYIFSKEHDCEMILKDGIIIYKNIFGFLHNYLINMEECGNGITDSPIEIKEQKLKEEIEIKLEPLSDLISEAFEKPEKHFVKYDSDKHKYWPYNFKQPPFEAIIKNDEFTVDFDDGSYSLLKEDPYQIHTLSEYHRFLDMCADRITLKSLSVGEETSSNLGDAKSINSLSAFADCEASSQRCVTNWANSFLYQNPHILSIHNCKDLLPRDISSKDVYKEPADGWADLAGHIMTKSELEDVMADCFTGKNRPVCFTVEDIRDYVLEGRIREGKKPMNAKDCDNLIKKIEQLCDEYAVYYEHQSLFHLKKGEKIYHPSSNTFSSEEYDNTPTEYESEVVTEEIDGALVEVENLYPLDGGDSKSRIIDYFETHCKRDNSRDGESLALDIICYFIFGVITRYGTEYRDYMYMGAGSKYYCNLIKHTFYAAEYDYVNYVFPDEDIECDDYLSVLYYNSLVFSDDEELLKRTILCVKNALIKKVTGKAPDDKDNSWNCFKIDRPVFTKNVKAILEVIEHNDFTISTISEYLKKKDSIADDFTVDSLITYEYEFAAKKSSRKKKHNYNSSNTDEGGDTPTISCQLYDWLNVLAYVKKKHLLSRKQHCELCGKAFYPRNSAERCCPICLTKCSGLGGRLKRGGISSLVKDLIRNQSTRFNEALSYGPWDTDESKGNDPLWSNLLLCAIAFSYNVAYKKKHPEFTEYYKKKILKDVVSKGDPTKDSYSGSDFRTAVDKEFGAFFKYDTLSRKMGESRIPCDIGEPKFITKNARKEDYSTVSCLPCGEVIDMLKDNGLSEEVIDMQRDNGLSEGIDYALEFLLDKEAQIQDSYLKELVLAYEDYTRAAEKSDR